MPTSAPSARPPTNAAYAKVSALAMLAQSELTLACPPQVLAELVDLGRFEHHPDGTYLYHLHDPMEDLVFVLHGKIECSRLGLDGRRHLLTILTAGQVLGLMSLFDGKGSPQDMRAYGPVTVWRVSLVQVRRLMAEMPALQDAIIRLICARSREAFDVLSLQALLPLHARVAWLVLWLVANHGLGPGDQRSINLKISQTAFADLLGVARQSANRELKLLERKGLICIGKTQIEVFDLAGLQQIVASGR